MIEYENLRVLNNQFIANYRIALDNFLGGDSMILGPEVTEFENEFAAYCGSPYCTGVGSGLDALTLSLKSFSFKEGSEVIVPSNTYIASILAILNSNLVPVLVEPDRASCNLDPNLIEGAITRRTVAIMAVHLYGKCCAMDEITTLKSSHNLKLIEDCAQAHGTKYKGRSAGTFGEFGAYSFYPTKNLGALGDAGCIVTPSEDLDGKVKMLRNYGSIEKDRHKVVGTNSRLDELQAAFLRIKLRSLDKMNEKRRSLAALYNSRLDERVIKPVVHDDYLDTYHIYNIRHPRRDDLRTYLKKHHIETMVHYPIPPHQQVALRGRVGASYPVSEEIHATTLSLPISPIHSDDDILEVIEALNKF